MKVNLYAVNQTTGEETPESTDTLEAFLKANSEDLETVVAVEKCARAIARGAAAVGFYMQQARIAQLFRIEVTR